MTIFSTLLAQKIGCGEGLGPLASFMCGLTPGNDASTQVGDKLNSVLSSIIGLFTIIAALWFAVQIILAGYDWINAGGDKNHAQAAFQKVTNAVVGLMVVVLAWVIIALLGQMLGLSILNPGGLIKDLQIK